MSSNINNVSKFIHVIATDFKDFKTINADEVLLRALAHTNDDQQLDWKKSEHRNSTPLRYI